MRYHVYVAAVCMDQDIAVLVRAGSLYAQSLRRRAGGRG